MWASRFLARSPAAVGLLIRFLFIGSRFCSTLLSDPASRRRPCASLSLHLHQVLKRTFTSQLSNMLGTQEKGRLAPALVCDSNKGATECESCCCWHRACRERARACLQTVSPGPDGRCHNSFRWPNPAAQTCHPASQQFR